MNYFMACPEPGMGTWYFEVDAEGVAYRQIVVEEDGSWVTSNRKHEQYHFMLAEHPIDLDDPYYEKIAKAQFEELWSRSLQATMEKWQQIKSTLPVGMKIEGEIEAFFPQGTLVDLFKQQAVGLANTAELSKTSPPEKMYPRHKLTATVKGYDEVNQWVVLEQAHMV